MDKLTKKQRSYCMSKIRSKWTKQEIKVHNWLKGNKIKHKMHPKIEGNPDIIFEDRKTVVFIHGCFWHKCPKCFKKPKSNIEYWDQKIGKNVKRDKKNERTLRKNGWRIIKLWEHEIKKNFKNVMGRLINDR